MRQIMISAIGALIQFVTTKSAQWRLTILHLLYPGLKPGATDISSLTGLNATCRRAGFSFEIDMKIFSRTSIIWNSELFRFFAKFRFTQNAP
jgi:hypothetical protein